VVLRMNKTSRLVRFQDHERRGKGGGTQLVRSLADEEGGRCPSHPNPQALSSPMRDTAGTRAAEPELGLGSRGFARDARRWRGSGAVEGDLSAAQEQAQGDGQVEPARVSFSRSAGARFGRESWRACLHALVEPLVDQR
jgi:hypothetical protein